MAAVKTKPPTKKPLVNKLQVKLTERADLLVAGYHLLRQIAARTSDDLPPQISEVEWSMLLASGACDGHPPSVSALLGQRNVFALQSIVNKAKAEQKLRQRLQDLPTITEAEKAVADAIAKESEAAQSLEQLDIGNLEPKTAKQVGALALALKQFRAAREESESTLFLVHDLRDRLQAMAPGFLTQRAKRICNAIPQRPDLGEARNELAMLEQTLSPENYSLNLDIKNGNMDNFAKIYCVEAVSPGEYGGPSLAIDRDKLYSGFDRLRAGYVPELRERVASLQATVDAATTEALLPIEKWTDDGEITVEMLLN